MRILICSEQPPLPPLNGVRVVFRSLLPEFERRHDVRVICFASPDEAPACDPATTHVVVEKRRLRHLALASALGRALLTGRPMRFDERAACMAPALREELEAFRPDVVCVISGGLAALGPALRGRPAVLGALDAAHRNVEAQAIVGGRIRRSLVSSEARRVGRFEATDYARFARVVVVSENDRRALEQLTDALRIEVIPNGVDADYFAPAEDATPDARVVAFHGVMDYAPNVSAACFLARSVWPHVRSEEPAARLLIVGRAPARRVRALAAVPGVEVTGEVPDVRPLLRSARIYACPVVSGTGIKNKLLEAMAHRMACVVTPLALGGLDVQEGTHVVAAEQPQDLAREIVSLMRDGERAAALGRAAREYVCAFHSWRCAALAYERVFEAVAAEASNSPVG